MPLLSHNQKWINWKHYIVHSEPNMGNHSNYSVPFNLEDQSDAIQNYSR